DSEIRKMGFDIQSFNINYEVNDQIRVITGPFENFTGTVISINKEKHKVKVMISMFGRETPVDVDFTEVEKIAD
ncbi:MAG: KOW motif-containing protein, partial [Clostridiales bacterium]|nr:KOW motif-containing protein [Clostridiales bacterium]